MSKETARKGMYIDESGVHRFLESGTAPTQNKQWYTVEIVHRVPSAKMYASKLVDVYATENTAVGFGFARVPCPFKDSGEVRSSAYVTRARLLTN